MRRVSVIFLTIDQDFTLWGLLQFAVHTSRIDCFMGFEQLAALKRELVAQAEQEKRKARKAPAGARKTGRKPAAAQETPVDPVVITISRLQKKFPLAFPKKPAPKLPLKLGIHKDLYAQAETLKLTNAEIKEAVKTWCQGSRYWACMTEGAARLDLT